MSLIERIAERLPSPLATRALRVHLGPEQLLAVVCKGAHPQPGHALRIGLDNPDGRWQTSVAALRALLSGTDHQGAGLPLEISLSGRWCQMLLAPWSDALLAEPGAGRYLQTQLAALYGDTARGWSVTGDDAPYGQPRLVCGMDRDLLGELRAAAAGHGHRCRAIEPLASVVWRGLAPGRPQACAIVEAGRMTLVALGAGQVTAIQSQPCGPAWRLELVQAWQRWCLRAPELAAIDHIAVVDMSPPGPAANHPDPAHVPVLPARFRMTGHPFGAAPATAPLREAA